MYNILKYDTAVNLSKFIKGNLVEIEYALVDSAKNYGTPTFEMVSFYDQARDTDRSQSYATGNGSEAAWSGTGVAIVQPSAYPVPENVTDALVQSTPITTSFGQYGDYSIEQNTGTPEVFEAAYQDAVTLFEGTEIDAIILSNHGGSFYSGFNVDGPTYDNDPIEFRLGVPQLANSLQTVAGPDGLDLLAFDECLMANIETVFELAPLTSYVVASQPTIPGTGYAYFDTLSTFEGISNGQTQEQASLELGTAFVENYAVKYPRNGTAPTPSTLSLTQTDSLDPLVQTLAEFVQQFNAMSDSFVSNFMGNLAFYGTKYSADQGYDYLQDLGMVALIARETTGASPELRDTANQVIQQLDDAVVVKANGFDPAQGYERFGHSGLTATIPLSPFSEIGLQNFVSQYQERAPRFEEATNWSSLIERTQEAYTAITPSRIYGDVVSPDLEFGLIESQADGQLSATLDIDRAVTDGTLENKVPYSFKNQLGNIQLKDVNIVLDVAAIEPGTLSLTVGGLRVDNEFTQANERDTISFNINDLPDPQKQQLENIYLKDLGEFSITADGGGQFVYDLTVEGTNHRFVPDTVPVNSPDEPLLLGYADMRNFSITPDIRYEHYFQLPVIPDSTEDDDVIAQAEIGFYVRPSDTETPYEFTISAVQNSGQETLKFRGVGDLIVPVLLDGSQTYSTAIKYEGTASDAAIDTAIEMSRLSDSEFNAPSPIIDYSEQQIGQALWNWGEMQDQAISSATVFSPDGQQIRNISDLSEGQALAGQITEWQRSPDSRNETNNANLVYARDSQLQFASSGVWFSQADSTIDISIQGVASRQASLGFFAIEGPNNAIARADGSFALPGDADYLELALGNLTDIAGQDEDLLSLAPGARDLSGSYRFEEQTYYGSLLMVKNDQGQDVALFSFSDGNAGSQTQLMPFGDGFYGYEDLIQGVDANYDGDFNDVVFMMG